LPDSGRQPLHQAATRALHEVWGKDTVFIRSGGSIPIVGDFDRHLGVPSVMMGFGFPTTISTRPTRSSI
jgi:acetylornithine deacetylase/succinyl-diaminopimelate desuccinylase-like protein